MNSKYKLETMKDNEESWGNLAKETAGIRSEGLKSRVWEKNAL